MAFETFDLGRVLQTAQAIKGMRAQTEDDKLRRQYLGTQIAGAQQQQQITAQNQQQQMSAQEAKLHYFQNHAIETAPDPIAAAKQLTPDTVAKFEAAHGAGSFDQLTPDQVRGLATYAKTEAGAIAGISPKVEWKDAGNQLMPFDEQGNPVKGIAPISKGASPDAQLSSQTSTANAKLSADTSRANNAATVGATMRGQDITADTTRQNNALKNPNSQQNLDSAWNVYQQAKTGLVKGLKGTTTNYFSGKMPAITTGQQVAEGGVAAMAPVLKQLFRVAGEGTFTDKDQELLLNMVPTRSDNPAARDAKLQNIDNIVRAKLKREAAPADAGADFIYVPGKGLQPAGQ